MNCAICMTTSSIPYHCCTSDKHCLCESCCINIISSIINNGKIALLLSNKIPCYICNEKFQYNDLPQNLQSDLNNILLTIPKTSKQPQSIQEFNYYYNEFNQLRHCITNKKFIFLTQRHYDLLGKAIEIYIQTLIKSNPWNYEEIWLPINDNNQNRQKVNIFISNDFRTNTNGCLILIQGCGVVRAGQWSRSCCINESLDIGGID
ncbi:unnamed protein product [Adineta steineri]|uniref:Arb2 domain-containing protein n=1 Tax=Adineta steineri TaxID=433720 RepID=A0A814S4N7_9BILA|nr:unnamed protein product [Adineta steineri]CAF1135384.1 unnamed protein product [Adineta steineri]CAF1142116.1 unnamed protein product [Adineta steineri]